MANPTEESVALIKATPEELQQAYRAVLEGDVLPEYADPEAMSLAIAKRIAEADSWEETFQPQTLSSWRDAAMGVPVLIKDVHLNRSSFDGQGPSVYAVVTISFPDSQGEMHDEMVTCGGRNVLVQLLNHIRFGKTDRLVRLTSKDTASGYDVLWLEAA